MKLSILITRIKLLRAVKIYSYLINLGMFSHYSSGYHSKDLSHTRSVFTQSIVNFSDIARASYS